MYGLDLDRRRFCCCRAASCRLGSFRFPQCITSRGSRARFSRMGGFIRAARGTRRSLGRPSVDLPSFFAFFWPTRGSIWGVRPLHSKRRRGAGILSGSPCPRRCQNRPGCEQRQGERPDRSKLWTLRELHRSDDMFVLEVGPGRHRTLLVGLLGAQMDPASRTHSTQVLTGSWQLGNPIAPHDITETTTIVVAQWW